MACCVQENKDVYRTKNVIEEMNVVGTTMLEHLVGSKSNNTVKQNQDEK
jgi:hypothetical protein